MTWPTLSCATLVACLAAPAGLLAQPAEVEQHTEAVVEAIPLQTTDSTTASAALGGSLNQGNTNAWQLTTGADFAMMRGPNAVTATARFAYGQTDDPTTPVVQYQDTVRNFNARVRYDYYLTDYDALFVAGVFRWDTFAGLDHRMQGQIGYLRVFYRAEKHRLWGEGGYDITYDNYDPDPLLQVVPNDAYMANQDIDRVDGGTNVDDNGEREFLDPIVLPGTKTVHSARVFLGYTNEINAGLSYVGGAEFLFNVEDSDDLRINWDNAIRSSINESLKLELKVSVQYDHQPVVGKKDTDLASVISVIYTLI